MKIEGEYLDFTEEELEDCCGSKKLVQNIKSNPRVYNTTINPSNNTIGIPKHICEKYGIVGSVNLDWYKTTKTYKDYYQKGKDCFHKNKDHKLQFSTDYLPKIAINLPFYYYYIEYPFVEGFEEARRKYCYQKYKLKDFSRELKDLCQKHGVFLANHNDGSVFMVAWDGQVVYF